MYRDLEFRRSGTRVHGFVGVVLVLGFAGIGFVHGAWALWRR